MNVNQKQHRSHILDAQSVTHHQNQFTVLSGLNIYSSKYIHTYFYFLHKYFCWLLIKYMNVLVNFLVNSMLRRMSLLIQPIQRLQVMRARKLLQLIRQKQEILNVLVLEFGPKIVGMHPINYSTNYFMMILNIY